MNLNRIFFVMALAIVLIGIVVVATPTSDVVEQKRIKNYERMIVYDKHELVSEVYYTIRHVVDVNLASDNVAPSKISAEKGETVALELAGSENCNFNIEGYGISTFVRTGQKKEISFNADIPGTFIYKCSKSNGLNEPFGMIIVK